MGVHGLWKLLEAAGKPVPLESLENKVLAVDVSIWLHQMMKGYQDSRGAPVANAHLLGLFHRVCKLLFYKIKPVFVFDGGVPLLKKQTIAARRKQKAQASQNASEAKERLLKNLVKKKAVRQLLHGSEVPSDVQVQADSAPKDDMFELPPLPENALNSESEDETEDRLKVLMKSGESASESESEPDIKPGSQLLHGFKIDLHSLDTNSEEFLSLPPDVRHDILSDLKETRKQNSWGRLHEMPEESGDFSNYQLGRLLKRRNVQVSLEQAEKEMGGKVMRINELQELMEAQGVEIIEDSTVVGSSSKRIASDSRTRFVLCKDPISSDLSSQDLDSSKNAEKDIKETEENQLYTEQAEFISQMAENMLQKLVKNKQVKNLSEEGVSKLDTSVTDCEVAPDKIHLDNWSDDDDIVINTSESAFKARKRKSPSVSPDLELIPSTGDTEPPQKVLKLHESHPSDNHEVKNDHLELTKTESFTNSESQNARTSNNEPFLSNKEKSNKIELESDKKSVEIVVRPGVLPEDDIFADIFQSKASEKKNEEPCQLKGKSESKIQSLNVDLEEKKNCKIDSKEATSSTSGTSKPLEIVISSTEAPGDDDIFADIFKKNDQSDMSSSVKIEVDSNCNPAELGNTSSSDSEQEFIEPDLASKPSIDIIKEEAVDDEEKDLESDHQEIKIVVKSDNDSSGLASGDESDSPRPSSIRPPLSPTLPMSSYDLNSMEASLEAENLDLLRERGRQERLAASITDQMCLEAQELLQLFGLPYLVAPMEAEAQCAFLDSISLTEGSITDDSDIWLFGGRKVYKNFFNQKKHVLQFTSSNISHYFKLSREQLIQLALLVGSDYTTGIQGVGPVTAMEIVATFQCKLESDPIQTALKGLSQFKEWWNSGRPHKSNSMRLLDKKLKNVKFSEGFPSQAVVEAYLRPSVENSDETFSWGALDLPALRLYAKSKFGWTVEKTDEILMPVSKRWSSRTSQRSIDSYFNFKPQLVEGLQKISKRVQKAVDLMGNDEESESVDDPDPKPSDSRKQKPSKQSSGSKTQNSTKAKRKQASKIPDHEGGGEISPNHERLKKRSKRVRGKGVTIMSNNDQSDGTDTEDYGHIAKRTETDTFVDLPVRAPTVPRERTATGVKRVGVKSSNVNKKLVTIVGSELEAVNSIKEKQIATRKPSNQIQAKLTSDSESDCTQAEPNTMSKSKQSVRGGDSRKMQAASLKSNQKRSEVIKNSKEAGTLPNNSYKMCSSASLTHIESDDGSCHDLPGCSKTGSSTDFSDMPSTSADGANLSSELAALSEMNWEDDPWDAENQSVKFSEEPRRKVYFGGIRPNKPRRPARPRTQNPVESVDSRGVQPGWVTRERLESRTAWVDDLVRRKREETIPQRERDQKAMEEAKMKAISIVKASEARNATRLLGRQPPKRGKGKVKVTLRKILPEHNLSESSSDD
ncbi:DNA repair protein complementing XP-G cells-like protein [Frankliniella fusca]|uniref:DNA repair protein complementing XP-G cells-like protein n=1 Tax=Frankliniella fusca TaxID=407009 RepID=A0AAE1LH78_9NEOP|nr:DNA repair protein complementing XP-G cells-like protein [Frankliniella fusca]